MPNTWTPQEIRENNVVDFPNPDEVTNGPRRFIIEERRNYIITAEDEDEALTVFCELDDEQAAEIEVDGGGFEVYPADH